ncbi:hypothetical protein ABZV80_32330 [Streptomyces sp. NPDC005132]|uniref:hypothetical protein n=1 Tax=Streptomyces sp. NPDC005132 TaxID=3154294 RepID=UPI0033BF91F9
MRTADGARPPTLTQRIEVSLLPPGRRAAVLSVLAAYLNYRYAGLDPLALAAAE